MQFSKREKWIAAVSLGLPLAAALTLTVPHYERFTTVGHIVKINELGIGGHVYMTYVEGGVTKNYLEKLVITIHYDDKQISFEPASKEDWKSKEEVMDEEEPFKEAVISNALKATDYAMETSQPINTKYANIMEKATEYVGDSFGLMVAIGLVEEESHTDFSRDGKYVIAGTGTVEEDGLVGSVGGIKEKVATAVQDGVDYFFVPKDKDRFLYEGVSNQEEAEQYANDHNLPVQIVPVDTLEEALTFLKNLP